MRELPVLIETSRLDVSAPGGRALIRDLSLSMGREQAALIGRNGAGKSTLLSVLSGRDQCSKGQLTLRTKTYLVPQELGPVSASELRRRFGAAFEEEARSIGLGVLPASGCSPGELRKLSLIAAKLENPGFLLLDEPTQDLDETGISWLENWLRDSSLPSVVVTHDRRLLELFRHFFLIEEAGCRYLPGSFQDVEAALERERAGEQRKYLRKLNVLADEEEKNEKINRRRARKKRLGRLHEEKRMPTSAQLHGNKSYAEQSQGKRAKVRNARITAARELVKAGRRALEVRLPLELTMPELPPDDGRPLIVLEDARAVSGDRVLFSGIDLSLSRRDRLGVMGPNGAGKTTLLQLMLKHAPPVRGPGPAKPAHPRRESIAASRVGSIAQGAPEWRSEESLLSRLADLSDSWSPDQLIALLVRHKFPLALAERPLSSLSPGERVRAALIALMQRSPAPELLVLDEPTYSLDLAGTRALAEGLRAWPGGQVVASHDAEFLAFIGVTRILSLPMTG